MKHPRPRYRTAGVLALLIAFCAIGCNDDDDDSLYGASPCRFDPAFCGGGPGATCRSDRECQGGFCCTEPANCGGGMCTYSCKGDIDCPADMGCEHGMCFFLCRSALDCAQGQHCGHMNTVCEWP